eukprot:4241680-Pleurochrysis_carterae.AAC.2
MLANRVPARHQQIARKAICCVSLRCNYEKFSYIQGGLEGQANAPEDNPDLPTLKVNTHSIYMADANQVPRLHSVTQPRSPK